MSRTAEARAVAPDPPDALGAGPQVDDAGFGLRRATERVQEPGRTHAAVGGARARGPAGGVVGPVEHRARPAEDVVHDPGEHHAARVDDAAPRVRREQAEPDLRLHALADRRGHVGEQVHHEQPVDVARDRGEVVELVEHRARPVRPARGHPEDAPPTPRSSGCPPRARSPRSRPPRRRALRRRPPAWRFPHATCVRPPRRRRSWQPARPCPRPAVPHWRRRGPR